MDDADLARAQMGLSLAFHIVFAAVGVALPALMVAAEVAWRRTGERAWLDLARAWAKGTSVLFAVGAVSGTVLSFELGLLFPGLMRRAGALIGPGFTLEAVAFFTEAIFLGLYLYGRERMSSALHLASAVVVALSGAASAVTVTLVNAWMQQPTGCRLDPATGALVDLDPVAALTSPFAPLLILHSLLAYYAATGFAVSGVHALALLRAGPAAAGADRHHGRALALALAMAAPCALAQPIVGHLSGEQVALRQPMKLAAMEGQYVTQRWAPIRLGGIPDHRARTTRWALELPGGLSILATGRPDGEVRGLAEFPEADWPSPVVHYAFQLMVGCGVALGALSAFALLHLARRRRWPRHAWFLRGCVLAGPLAFLALEAGWVVTEVGRQPWVAYGLLRTRDLVTPMPGLVVPCVTFALVYLGLTAGVVHVLRRLFAQGPGPTADHPAPDAPPPAPDVPAPRAAP